MQENDFQTIHQLYAQYQALSCDQHKPLKTSLNARMRIILGIHRHDNQKKMDKQLEKTLTMTWNIAWLRIPFWPDSQPPFLEWLRDQAITHLLVLEAKQENEKALNMLRSRYQKSLYFHIRNQAFIPERTIHFDEHVSIMLEEVFYRAWHYLPHYNPYESTFYTWLLTIAKSMLRKPPAKKDSMVTKSADEEDDYHQDGESWIERQQQEDSLAPDQALALHEMGGWLLQTLCRDGGYPWQVLVTLLYKLNYTPQQIEKHMGPQTLIEILAHVKHGFSQVSIRSTDELEYAFHPLEHSLDLTIDQTLGSGDNPSRKSLSHMLNKKAGELKLSDFFGKRPNKNISDWHARTMIRLAKAVESEDAIT